MAFQFSHSDQEILVSIAEHRVLTVHHLTILHQRNASALRRRLKILHAHSLIEIASRPFGRSRGRPESLVSLCEGGVDLLKAEGVIDAALSNDRATAERIGCVDHELLVNDFRTQLVQLKRVIPALTIRFFSAMSPLLPRGSQGQPLVRERIEFDDGLDDEIEFVPDGVVAMTHAELRRTLLFFLEADRGTEPRNSTRRDRRGIRQKIVNYQTYFAAQEYKRYEKIMKCQLRGFRLLILTENRVRFAALCRLVRVMPPSDFVWLAFRESLLEEGVWAPIWAAGGKVDGPLQSVLGSRMPNPCPTPVSLTLCR